MKNIVLIPCHSRADFLNVNLNLIEEANNSDKQIYLFLIDRGFDPEIIQVINKFKLDKSIHYTPKHNFRGNSYNLLEGYKFAYEKYQDSELVYMLEEDIFIGKDFFDFHERVQSQFESFCVSAVWCHVDNREFPNEPASIYCKEHYQSLGVSWRREYLKEVVKHANPKYYRNMLAYCVSQFPKSKYGRSFSEQDGLINRIREQQNNAGIIYPIIPRAFHAGAIGYNRPGKKLEGDLETRSKLLKSMSKEQLNEMATHMKDIKPCSLIDYGIIDFEYKSM